MTLKLENIAQSLEDVMAENFDKLTAMDQVVGDGDLGITMKKGFAAANAAFDAEEEDLGKNLFQMGRSIGNAVPSTMGTLMARGLMQSGKNLKGQNEFTAENIILFLDGVYEGVQNLGGAELGEKTFLDSFYYGLESLRNEISDEKPLEVIFDQAEKEALIGHEKATDMKAEHGRAATRGEASIGVEDPGAYVGYLWFVALRKSLD